MAIRLPELSTVIQEAVTAPRRSLIGRGAPDGLYSETALLTHVTALNAAEAHCTRALALNSFLS